MSALAAALRGDDVLLRAIDAADPDTFGIGCDCSCYHVGKLSEMDPQEATCPECGSTRGWFESPALGSGPKSVRKAMLGKGE